MKKENYFIAYVYQRERASVVQILATLSIKVPSVSVCRPDSLFQEQLGVWRSISLVASDFFRMGHAQSGETNR